MIRCAKFRQQSLVFPPYIFSKVVLLNMPPQWHAIHWVIKIELDINVVVAHFRYSAITPPDVRDAMPSFKNWPWKSHQSLGFPYTPFDISKSRRNFSKADSRSW